MTLFCKLKRAVVRPLPLTSAHAEERLSRAAGLAVFSADALSSIADDIERNVLMWALAGSQAPSLLLPLAVTVVLLLTIVILSYR